MTTNDCKTCFAIPGETMLDLINPNTGRGLYGGKDLVGEREKYPGAVIMNVAEFCAEKGRLQDSPFTWTEVTPEIYHEMLEVLPPAAWVKGAFLVGEPMDHHAASGLPRYDAFWHSEGKYLAASRPITVKEFQALFC